MIILQTRCKSSLHWLAHIASLSRSQFSKIPNPTNRSSVFLESEPYHLLESSTGSQIQPIRIQFSTSPNSTNRNSVLQESKSNRQEFRSPGDQPSKSQFSGIPNPANRKSLLTESQTNQREVSSPGSQIPQTGIQFWKSVLHSLTHKFLLLNGKV